MNTLLSILMVFSSYIYQVMDLWPNGPEESNGIVQDELVSDKGRISNVSVPQISVMLPSEEKNTRAAVVICPGGGYYHQTAIKEGFKFAEWFCDNGIAAIVLKYRLPNEHCDIPVKDAFQAIKTVRENADKWHIDADKIGIAGFSAGGHLASTAGTHFVYLDSIQSKLCRPDFMLLFYPVISMQDGVTHQGSRNLLLGKQPKQELVEKYSNHLQVSAQCPPCLLLLCDDDKAVIPENSILFYHALKENKVPASMYIFPEGGHGFGFKQDFRYHETMKKLVLDWLDERQFTK